MKKLILTIAGVTALMLGGITSAATSAAADVDDLAIGTIGYNAYGNDSLANRNQEYVDIINTGSDKNVKGLLFEDAYRHGNPTSYSRACNRYVVDKLPDVTGDLGEVLPAGHVLRIYVGSAPTNPKAFVRSGKTIHPVYINSPERCGYHGHFLNNKAASNPWAPWDTVWITLDGQSDSKGYNFSFGYVAG